MGIGPGDGVAVPTRDLYTTQTIYTVAAPEVDSRRDKWIRKRVNLRLKRLMHVPFWPSRSEQ
jgi:hypothetical protein